MAVDFAKILKRNASKITSENPSDKKFPASEQERSEENLAPSEPAQTPSEKAKAPVNRTRNKTMNLRFSPEELEEMNDKISVSGLSKTDFILECVRDHDVILIEDLSAAMTEIRKQGVNLNQIAKSLNEYAVGLNKYGIRLNNENATWRTITGELEALREENQKTQELLKKIQEAVNQAMGKR